MIRKNKGLILIIIGCFLLLIAGGWYIYNIFEDKNAGEYAAEILEKFEEAKDDIKTEEETPVIIVEGDSFCGRVIIDKLGIELPVYNGWDYKRLKKAPCRYTGSIATDDIIIAAHNYKSHFGTLNKLEIGDEITFADAYGKIHYYEVQELITLDGTAISDMKAGGWDLTLFTCTKGGAQRVTVRCERK